MAHFCPQGLLLSVLLMVKVECTDVSTVIVSAQDDESVVLPCFNSNETDPKSCYRVKWTNLTQKKVILVRPETSKIPDAERVKAKNDGKGQMSLILEKPQKSDEGLYTCEIWKGWDCVVLRNISLKVKECKVLQAVKVAPSAPVNLNCAVDMTSGQQGPRNISWVMLKGGNPIPVISKSVEMNGTSLVIQSVNYSDSGWYRCKYMLGQTQRCFDINLQVQVENVVTTMVPVLTTSEILLETRKQEGSETLIAVVTSVIVAIGVMAALIGLTIYHRRNSQRVAPRTPRHPTGSQTSVDGYEVVNLTCSEVPKNQQVNSLYLTCQDESTNTLQY